MINIGVIGYGYWGPNLVRNFGENPDIDVIYVCDRDEVRLANLKSKMPAVKTPVDYMEVLRDDNINLVAIATPVATHYQIAKDALTLGKHVLIEKPMTLNVKQALELIELSKRQGLHIFVDHTYLFTGAVKKIKELYAAGEMGDVLFFDSVRVNLGLFQSDVNVIWDLAPHDFSIMAYLIEKEPTEVSAIGAKRLYDAFEDIAYVTVKFEGGLIAHFHVNWMSPVKIRRIIVGASKKMVVFDDLSADEKIKVYDKGIRLLNNNDNEKSSVYNTLIQYRVGDVFIPKVEAKEALKVEVAHIVDCLKNNATPISDGYTGLRVMKLLEATNLSLSKNGAFVPIG
ncbi:MAG: Gfo/Idh/MocA family oxidoreductase [Candidatus Magnetoovum sp. WYHC-5]|nr:Gfo/Idh/MocA family oxidoreductase [Candidatus Magnetoovum sp. WYHC-5]